MLLNGKLFLSYLLILLFSYAGMTSCKGQKTKKASDSKHFASVFQEDSVEILEFKKFKDEFDPLGGETITYIDYRKKSADKDSLSKFSFANHIAEINEFLINDSISSENSVKNPYKELKNIYVAVNKYKSNYCLYYIDLGYLSEISDTAFTRFTLEGYESYYFTGIQQVKNTYVIDFNKNNPDLRSIEIKFLHDTYHSTVWKTTILVNEDEYNTFYELLIPVQYAISLPILYTLDSSGLDDIYEGFDALDIQALFEQ